MASSGYFVRYLFSYDSIIIIYLQIATVFCKNSAKKPVFTGFQLEDKVFKLDRGQRSG